MRKPADPISGSVENNTYDDRANPGVIETYAKRVHEHGHLVTSTISVVCEVEVATCIDIT